MPLVRMLTSVADGDEAWSSGEQVQLDGPRAQQYVAAGWAELVRGGPEPETPEGRSRPGRRPRAESSTQDW